MKKDFILGVIGLMGAYIAQALGGWTTALATLFIFMIVDYVTGFIVAAVFKKSTKLKVEHWPV